MKKIMQIKEMTMTGPQIKILLHRRFCLIVGGEVGLSTEEVVACKIVEHLKKT